MKTYVVGTTTYVFIKKSEKYQYYVAKKKNPYLELWLCKNGLSGMYASCEYSKYSDTLNTNTTWFICVGVLQSCQPIGVMWSMVSLPTTLLLGRLSPLSS